MTIRALAVLGTGSDVGKTVIVAGLCRLFARAGVRVAPFKAQNMSNNSSVTADGRELGRAQALQAQACGIEPTADMNPILLKPESDQCAQIVAQGRVWGKADGRSYFAHHTELSVLVMESYRRLSGRHDLIVIEGAGSAAEMNLRDRDLANWFIAERADARVLLVADIERGGVFAQVIGTLDLLRPEERNRVIGIIINKFRGDITLFEDGKAIIEERTGIPVLGVLPLLRDLLLDQEDSLRRNHGPSIYSDSGRVKIAVVLLPHMSNFTDFNQLAAEPDVDLRYVESPHELAGFDVIIIPGTKTTIDDLRYLRHAGFVERLNTHVASKQELVGICGGFQMLGRHIADEESVESGGNADGLGFLDVATRMLQSKRTQLIEAQTLLFDAEHTDPIRGYYIHMGASDRGGDRPCFKVQASGAVADPIREAGFAHLDGAMNGDGLVWGTYIHGLFDQPGFRRAWLNRVRYRKGWDVADVGISRSVSLRFEGELDRWADHIEKHLDLHVVFDQLVR